MTPKSPSQRRLNPLVDRYVTTDLPIHDIARQAPGSHPLVDALLKIHESLQGRRLAKDAIAAARAVQIKGSDPELMILMLNSWAELSNSLGRPAETEALIERANAMISDNTHPLVRAYALFARAALENSRGNKSKSEKILRSILAIVPEHSARRKFYAWELALFLAQQGRAAECRKEIRSLTWQCNERFDLSRILMVQFVDAMETGNIREASELMPKIAVSAQTSRNLVRIPYRGYQLLLYMMHGHGEQAARNTERDARSFLDQPATPDWIKVVHSLLNHDAGQALELARREANRVLDTIMGSGFDSYTLVRSELAAGHPDAARHVLNLRQSRGNRHYLDNFFLARADMLEGKPGSAADAFAELLTAVDFYSAQGRLDFEMKMACELSHGDIVKLTQAAGERRKKKARVAASIPLESETDNEQARPGKTPGNRGLARQEAVNVIIGRSLQTRQIRETILRFAMLDTPVLITGETGTGKELIAQALHRASEKHDLPFTAVNCSSITETLLESELFGYERGAFTGAEKTTKGLFEATGKGVIFLDEIGDISPRLQLALLRVLETGEIRAVGSSVTRKINCRVIAATNADLEERAKSGTFRNDLLYRLQRLMIHLPPLRERPNDILPLVRHFLDTGRRVGSHAALTPELIEAVKAYDWPGNVRELKNVVERMRLMHSDKLAYSIEDLDLKFQPVAVLPDPEKSQPHRQRQPERGSSNTPEEPLPVPEAGRRVTRPTSPYPAGVRSEQVETFLKTGRSQLRRLDRLRELFRQYGKMTRNEIIHILAISPNTATKDLKALCDEDYIRRVEPSASTRSHYFVLTDDQDNHRP